MSSLVRKLQCESVLTNPTTLFTFASIAMQQVSSGQLVLSQASRQSHADGADRHGR